MTYADEIEQWLRLNGALYLTTARHAIHWPAGASAGDFDAAVRQLIEQRRIVAVEGGITGTGYRVPGIWPEWIARLGDNVDLATRVTIQRCKQADALAAGDDPVRDDRWSKARAELAEIIERNPHLV